MTRVIRGANAAGMRAARGTNAADLIGSQAIFHVGKTTGGCGFARTAPRSPAEYSAGLKLAIERGWLWMHESGTYVKFTPEGVALFA
jgi:hypothetical protein